MPIRCILCPRVQIESVLLAKRSDWNLVLQTVFNNVQINGTSPVVGSWNC